MEETEPPTLKLDMTASSFAIFHQPVRILFKAWDI
jgi:hypothetical protein